MAIPITGNAFLKIPTPIISDILARLTSDEVGRCRCVCKDWVELLSEADFVNLHLSKSQTCLILHNISLSQDSVPFHLVEIEDETHDVRYKAQIPSPREIQRSSQATAIYMIGSVNGLVCIYDITYRIIHVWNPIIAEFITIQTPAAVGEKRKFHNVVTYGFGISSAGKYHVVRIFQNIKLKRTSDTTTSSHQILDSTCHIYTLGTGFWKSIDHAPNFHSCRHHGLFLDGNLHWLVWVENGPEICCLDLQSESFRPIPPPPELPNGNHLATLNVYRGCISVCDNTSEIDIVIWVMKEYGEHDSWTKEVVISKHLIGVVGRYNIGVHIVKVFEDGEMLLLWRGDVFCYHPNTKTVQDSHVQETMTGFSSNPFIEARAEFVPSIVSLKTLGEVNVYRA